jgi:hypothetical protein
VSRQSLLILLPHHIRRLTTVSLCHFLNVVRGATIIPSGLPVIIGALPRGEKSMKKILVCAALLVGAATLLAQEGVPYTSPKVTESVTIGGKKITVVYCSPGVHGREGHIFTPGGIIQQTHKSYPVWRGGANDATALHTDADLSIGDLKVPAGTYTLFVDISDPAQWTLIVSKDTGEWGLNYDKTKDLGKVKMRMAKPPSMVEDLKYTLTDRGGNKGTLNLAWENVSATVSFQAH